MFQTLLKGGLISVKLTTNLKCMSEEVGQSVHSKQTIKQFINHYSIPIRIHQQVLLVGSENFTLLGRPLVRYVSVFREYEGNRTHSNYRNARMTQVHCLYSPWLNLHVFIALKGLTSCFLYDHKCCPLSINLTDTLCCKVEPWKDRCLIGCVNVLMLD